MPQIKAQDGIDVLTEGEYIYEFPASQYKNPASLENSKHYKITKITGRYNEAGTDKVKWDSMSEIELEQILPPTPTPIMRKVNVNELLNEKWFIWE